MVMLQIDIKMPNACVDCPFLDDSEIFPYCILLKESRGFNFAYEEKRFNNCPLKEQTDETDMVKVVRCKDCKHSEYWYGNKYRCFMWQENGIDVFEDGFCNYGK